MKIVQLTAWESNLIHSSRCPTCGKILAKGSSLIIINIIGRPMQVVAEKVLCCGQTIAVPVMRNSLEEADKLTETYQHLLQRCAVTKTPIPFPRLPTTGLTIPASLAQVHQEDN